MESREHAAPAGNQISQRELDTRFTYHAPKGDQQQRYTDLRDAGKELAEQIVASTPPSREQALALTKLEEAIMWANTAIARRE